MTRNTRNTKVDVLRRDLLKVMAGGLLVGSPAALAIGEPGASSSSVGAVDFAVIGAEAASLRPLIEYFHPVISIVRDEDFAGAVHGQSPGTNDFGGDRSVCTPFVFSPI